MKNDHGTEVFLEKNFQFQNCSNQFTALTYVLVHLHSELPLTLIQEIPQSLAVHIHPLRTKQCQLGSAKFINIFHSSEKLNKSSSDRILPWLSEFGTLQRQAKLKGDDTVSLSLPLRWGQILFSLRYRFQKLSHDSSLLLLPGRETISLG